MAFATRPKPNTHSRKRHAGHHRHDKRYMKSYWPYLPMLLIVGLGLLVNSIWANSGVLGTQSDLSSASLLSSTNAERAKQGEPALKLDPKLTAAAQAKADDMVKQDYWAHDSPDGKTPWVFITASGYQYQIAGENLAYGFDTASESIAGWMASPEHRANILNSDYQDVGFGVASSPDYIGEGPETVIVAEYGQLAAAGAVQPDQNVFGTQTESKPVTRIQTLSGDQSEWSLVAVIILSGCAMVLLLTRYGFRFQRLLTRGEAFVVHHPYLDIGIIFVITAGIVLTRASGIIH